MHPQRNSSRSLGLFTLTPPTHVEWLVFSKQPSTHAHLPPHSSSTQSVLVPTHIATIIVLCYIRIYSRSLCLCQISRAHCGLNRGVDVVSAAKRFKEYFKSQTRPARNVRRSLVVLSLCYSARKYAAGVLRRRG